MSTKRKHRFPLFYAILLCVVVLALIVTHILLGQLGGFLTEYEAVQPSHLADEIYETYFKGGVRFAEILAKTGYSLSPFETEGQLESYLASLAPSAEPVMERVSTQSDDVQRYVILSGDDKIAAFNLRRGEPVTFSLFGHPFRKLLWLFEANTWSLDGMELFWAASETAVVKAPRGAVVRLNGVPVDGAYLVGEPELTESCAHMPEGTEGLAYVTYRIEKLLRQPYVTVTDWQGREIQVLLSDGVYTAEAPYDAALESKMASYALQAVESYACYMQEDMSLSDIRRFFDTSSPLFESIRTTDRFVWEHDRYEFRDVSVGAFYAYDDNTFSCRIGFTHVLIKGKSTWSDAPLCMTVYFRKIGGNYVIYEMVND